MWYPLISVQSLVASNCSMWVFKNCQFLNCNTWILLKLHVYHPSLPFPLNIRMQDLQCIQNKKISAAGVCTHTLTIFTMLLSLTLIGEHRNAQRTVNCSSWNGQRSSKHQDRLLLVSRLQGILGNSFLEEVPPLHPSTCQLTSRIKITVIPACSYKLQLVDTLRYSTRNWQRSAQHDWATGKPKLSCL